MKNQKKIHNEFGKVTNFGTSLFSWRNGCLKEVQADSVPPNVCNNLIVVLKTMIRSNFYENKANTLHQFFWDTLYIECTFEYTKKYYKTWCNNKKHSKNILRAFQEGLAKSGLTILGATKSKEQNGANKEQN